MTISPIGSVTSVPVAAAAAGAEPASLGATAAQQAEGSDYLLYGESGLVIQSYGAIALISPAALLYASAALPGAQPRPLVAPVEAVAPVARVRAVDAIA